MAKVLHYFVHPGQQYSRTNVAIWDASKTVDNVTRVDLYAEYPRFNIDIAAEQKRLLDHDIIVFQFPVFWYSAPSLMKEWIDLTLQHGFAYGDGGDKLRGKCLMLAVTAAGPEEAYAPDGFQNHALRTFLTPFEQTATLCKMHFLAPFVQYSALRSDPTAHVTGFVELLTALRDDRLDLAAATSLDILSYDHIPLLAEA